MSSLKVSGFSTGLEQTLRPFTLQQGFVLSRVTVPDDPDPTPVAEIVHAIWGGPSNLSLPESQSGPPGEPDPEPDPEKGGILDFEEVEDRRKVKKVRVENPDDASQWVEFDDPISFVFKPPTQLLTAMKRPLDELWQFKFVPPKD